MNNVKITHPGALKALKYVALALASKGEVRTWMLDLHVRNDRVMATNGHIMLQAELPEGLLGDGSYFVVKNNKTFVELDPQEPIPNNVAFNDRTWNMCNQNDPDFSEICDFNFPDITSETRTEKAKAYIWNLIRLLLPHSDKNIGFNTDYLEAVCAFGGDMQWLISRDKQRLQVVGNGFNGTVMGLRV